MSQRAIDAVNISVFGKKSVEYAKCRAAINQDVNTLYKDNAAAAKNYKVLAKKKVILHLGGHIEMVDGKKFVMFPDKSQARY